MANHHIRRTTSGYTLPRSNIANPLTVTLSGQGNGAVIADAIRIVPNTPNQTQSTSYYIHTDHLNTPRVIVNANNQRRWTWYPEQAEAFGANLPNENPTNLINGTPKQLGSFSYHLRFPGQLFNPATGLSYNYFRDYNPRTGRFHESDPIGLAGGINTYAYVNGNPLWWVDPRGEKRLLNVIEFYQYGKCASLLPKIESARKSCDKECPPDASLRKTIEFID